MAADPRIIDLGGPRKASVAIIEFERDYHVEVRLIPVRSFDAGMNRRLSQDKARACAVEALIRYLGGKKEQTATIRNLEIVESNVVDSRFVLNVRIPRNGVTLTKASKSQPEVNHSRKGPNRSPFKAKDDFEETLKMLTDAIMAELPHFNGNMDEFYREVSDAEELGVTRLTALKRDIKADRWLLSIEREELLKAVATAETQLLATLKERIERVPKEAAKASAIIERKN
ncbi:MAG: hypothetical protein SGI77_11870 [Pirellulaceae bacterium]|nr:hypothetical protein [Pirellulaceae bacterium]